MENILFAGFGRESITPAFSVPLAGYGATDRRMSTNVLSEIYVSCIAFVSGEEKLLLFTQDLIRCNPKWTEGVRPKISAKTGVPEQRIMICSTHTHSAPDVLSDLPCMTEDYRALYDAALVAAAEAAMADLAPVTLYGGRTETKGMNFIRHYLLENGTYAGPNFGDFTSAPVVDHAAPNDPELLVVKLERQEKPSILMVNFQAHPTSTGGNSKPDISSDFVGVTRDYMEASTGMHFAYFTGAAGNQVMGTRIAAERDHMTTAQYKEFGGSNCMIYGWRLAQYIKIAIEQLKPVDSSTFGFATVQFEQPVNHEDEAFYDVAVETRRLWREADRATANRYARANGLSSIFHATAVIGRRNRPETNKMELDAVRIGDFAFVTMPYEAFCANGVYVKAHSPFPMTMIFSCANAGWNYIPTKEAYEYGCYESYTSYFAKGTGENAAEKLTEMLKNLQ